MTKSVIAYGSRSEAWADEIGGWITGRITQFIGVGLAISVLPFSLGAMIAPDGNNRLRNGMDATVTTHAFLWSSAGQAISVIAPPVQNWLDNGDDFGKQGA